MKLTRSKRLATSALSIIAMMTLVSLAGAAPASARTSTLFESGVKNTISGTKYLPGKQAKNTSMCVSPSGVASVSAATISIHSCASSPVGGVRIYRHPIVVTPVPWSGGPIAGTQWISAQADAGSLLATPAFYDYDVKFKDNCPATETLTGSAYSDDAVGVYVDNTWIANQGTGPLLTLEDNQGLNSAAPLAYTTTQLIHTGSNVVNFIVEDINFGYTGLDYSFTVTCNIG